MTTRVSIKVALAWSTCAQMGFMLVECGLGGGQVSGPFRAGDGVVVGGGEHLQDSRVLARGELHGVDQDAGR
ncbi:hypothetical protein NL529_28150, partial [Klebsiella pneumoniae]|nr:hypothetical protein [Klebsiella pneumoniae]